MRDCQGHKRENEVEICGRDFYCGRPREIVKAGKVPGGFAVTLSRPLIPKGKLPRTAAPSRRARPHTERPPYPQGAEQHAFLNVAIVST
jgi:hypothetical protein